MSEIRKGIWLEASSEYQGRVLFSVATDQVDKETFLRLWHELGSFMYNRVTDKEAEDQLRIRVVPIGLTKE